MHIFKKWFGWLFNNRTNGHDSDHPDINPLDINTLKIELKVKEEAERLGRAGVPAKDDKSLTHIELRIWQRIEAARSNYQRWANVRLKLIHDKMITYDITKLVNRSLEYANEFKRNANRVISGDLAELNRLQLVAAGKQAQLDQFRLDNKLTRRAKEVSGLRKTIFVLVALGLVGLEGILNAGFFAQGLDGGLAEGFAHAFALAMINVVFALSFGYAFAPYKNHVDAVYRFFGRASIGFVAVVVFFLGLTIAHFRDSLSLGVDLEFTEVSAMAWQSLLASPFGLHDMFSFLLFGVSCFFGGFAWFEGYSWGDTYPGYGALQLDSEKAVTEYEERLSIMRTELEDLKDECLHKLEADIDQAKDSVLAFKSQIDRKEKSRHRLQLALGKAEDILVALIGEFRTNNYVCLRELGQEKPSYFDDPVPIKELEWPDFSTEEDECELDKQEKMLRGLLSSLEDIRAQIQSSFDSTFDQLKPIRDQI